MTRVRTNRQIRCIEVRIPDQGVMPTSKALALAEELGLDLVEIAPQAKPPVCLIVDYGRWQYERDKNAKRTKPSETKEVKFGPRTEAHDLAFKTKNVVEFLAAGHRVLLVVTFRGREQAHPEIGHAVLAKVRDAANANFIGEPRLEGRKLSVTVTARPTAGSASVKPLAPTD